MPSRMDFRQPPARLLDTASRVPLTGRILRSVRRFRGTRGERGQTILEFALIIPIMLVFLLIVVDFGLAMDRRIVLQHAVREGAREAATGASVAEIQQVTAEPVGIPESKVQVCYRNSDGNSQTGNVGDDVRVYTVDVNYRFTTGGTEMLTAFGVSTPQIPMNPSAEMRLETTVPVPSNLVCPVP
jgi:Flp pilus assembly protein TadG